jgi:hypothetical protein
MRPDHKAPSRLLARREIDMAAIMVDLVADGKITEATACREQLKEVSAERSKAAEQELREARVRRRYASQQ